MKLADFSFQLPDDLIAREPLDKRDESRLLLVSSEQENFSDRKFSDLPALLKAGDLLVLNDTKVIPARMFAKLSEAKIEAMLHRCEKSLDSDSVIWRAFVRPARKCHVGDILFFSEKVTAEIIARDGAEALLKFPFSAEEFLSILEEIGNLPLPPYLRRAARADDYQRYQTVYAQKNGAVAAPTAGLHFTEELFAQLDSLGVERCFVTLHVGAGTFLPVKVDDIKNHKMHAEYGEISADIADRINQAKACGRRIIAVGTTVTRLLESAADANAVVREFAEETDIFITPGYKFKIVDALITNFHLPESTLFMLVSAFSGLQKMQAAYANAIAKRYRFYSYGDACFLEASKKNF